MSGEFPFKSVRSLNTPGFQGPKGAPPFVRNFFGTGGFIRPTPPPGLSIIGYFVKIRGAGGGGGQGGAQSGAGGNTNGARGGPGGGFASAFFTAAAIPAFVLVTIGSGGVGASGGSTNTAVPIPAADGTDGGDSSFGTFISATGGKSSTGTVGVGTVTGPGQSNPVTENGGAPGLGSIGATPATAGGSTLNAGPGGSGGGGTTGSNTGMNGGPSATGDPGGLGNFNVGLAGNGVNGSGGGGCLTTTIDAISGNGSSQQTPGNGGGGAAAGVAEALVLGNRATAQNGGLGNDGFCQVIVFFG